MSLSGRHLRTQQRALEQARATRARWAAWRHRLSWLAVAASVWLWLQGGLAGRRPTPANIPWMITVLALLVTALVEWSLARACRRQQQALERTEHAIGWGPGPYRLHPPPLAKR